MGKQVSYREYYYCNYWINYSCYSYQYFHFEMKIQGEFHLSFETDTWICKQDDFQCKAKSLEELDRLLLQNLNNKDIRERLK